MMGVAVVSGLPPSPASPHAPEGPAVPSMNEVQYGTVTKYKVSQVVNRKIEGKHTPQSQKKAMRREEDDSDI